MGVELHDEAAPGLARGQVGRRALTDRLAQFDHAQARMRERNIALVLAVDHGDDLGIQVRVLKHVRAGARQPLLVATRDEHR